VIESFRSADTRRLFGTGKSKRFGAILTVATCKLTQLAESPQIPPCAWHVTSVVMPARG